ncbi:MAG TPA: D-aminoacylase [Bacillota bacterium]|nr:D-aminoacylase [Bacillota bacterium]
MTSFDFIIKNSRMVDGTGSPWRYADVAIKDGLIARIGALSDEKAEQVIDGEGLYLTPGFVDIHTHADREVESMPSMENYLRQGVTTLLGGNCGFSVYPVADHLGKLDAMPLGINYGVLVGHGSLRAVAMGLAMRAPSDDELKAMSRLAGEAMEEGAFGMSLGLYYAPGSFAEEPEVTAVSKAIAAKGGVITIHIRDESDYNVGLLDALREAIAIAANSGVAVQISHLKCMGKATWGKASEALSLIDQARQRGLDVTFDQYPYEASGTGFTGAIIPRWAQDGGLEALSARLADPEIVPRIRVEMLENIDRRGGAHTLVVALHAPNPDLQGKNMQEVGVALGMEPVDAAIAMQLAGGANLVSFNMKEEDIVTIMRHPGGMVVSDGGLVSPGQGMPHPRYYGTFPRFLSRYVRDMGLMTMEEGVRRMTSAPAHRVGLWDRGLIAPGMAADLLLIDYEKLSDNSTFSEPHAYNSGIHTVMINGRIALDPTGNLIQGAGQVLKGPATKEV